MQVDTCVKFHGMVLNGLAINILRFAANECICALLNIPFDGESHFGIFEESIAFRVYGNGIVSLRESLYFSLRWVKFQYLEFQGERCLDIVES